MRETLLSILVAAIAYLLGCFSTGLTVSGAKGVDIRNRGSKNTGASNVLRVMGLKSGLITFAGDFLKAALACWIGSLILPGSTFGIARYGMMLAGCSPSSGTTGRCSTASRAARAWLARRRWCSLWTHCGGAIAIAACVAVIALTRFISLGSMTMLFCYMVLMCIAHWGQWAVCLFTVVLFAMCVWRHRSNIQRLLSGTENRIGQKAK